MSSTSNPRAARPSGPGGRPPRTTHAKILQAALDIARSDGLATVSLRTVARRVGVHQTSLYNYFDTKEALLQAMLDHLFGQDLALPGPDDPREPVDQLKEIARKLRQTMADHVELLGLVGSTPTTEIGAWKASETVLALLGRLGLSPIQQTRVYYLLYQLLLANGFLAGNQERTAREATRASRAIEPQTPDEQFPHTSQAIEARGPVTPDTMFEDSLVDIFDIYVPALLARADSEGNAQGHGRTPS